MTSLATAPAHGPVFRTIARLPGLLGGIHAALRNRAQYRHLEELPDYLLDDVGLTRADLRRARGWGL